MKTWLLDTGPLVAYLDRTDDAHAIAAEALSGFRGQLATTGAVITEAMYFASTDTEGPSVLAEFVTASRLQIFDLCQPGEIRDAATLMRKYRDTPMDYADATLVLLAEAMNVHDILTLDRRGFSTYRTRRRRAFRLALG